MTQRIPVVENILNANDRLAEENRARLDAAAVFSINLMASPGAGKTSVIEQTLPRLKGRLRVAAVDGDIATSLDADRAAAAGAGASVQINTGGECHLDAVMLRGALDQLDLGLFDLLLVENVGNLVCPAEFQLGTHKSILIASVPEGPQYGLYALLQAANSGDRSLFTAAREYARRARATKEIFLRHGFRLVYDNDLGEPLADGFYYTISHPRFDHGADLAVELLHYGVSAITLESTGSCRKEGLRACVSLIGEDQYAVLDDRLREFS